MQKRIGVVIPALNEEESIALVVNEIPSLAEIIVVIDNGSSDNTKKAALEAGAIVLDQPIRGYGHACKLGVDHLRSLNTDIIVFLDGDYSDYPEELPLLVHPILYEDYDVVIGSRATGKKEAGALLFQAIIGNWLASFLINLFWGVKYTDLGPFRAIKMSKFDELSMCELTYGWTVELQIKAAKRKMKILEVPVRYRRRIGKSKVTGTLSGTLKASYGILKTIFKHLFTDK